MFSNGKSLLLEYLLALWLGLMVSGLHAQEEPSPANIPGRDASDDFHDNSKSRASISSYHTRYCDCNGSFTNRFVELPTTYGRPQSIQITSIEVRGDLASSNEYIDFKVSGTSNWIRYQGGADSANYRRYSYFSTQPTISYNYSSSSYGFYFDYFVSSAVNTSPSGISPAGVFYNIKVNYTVSFADPGPITPPSFNSITPGNGRLTLNITPPSSGPTPVLYHGYCGRSAGQEGASLNAPISISAFGVTSSYLAPVADSERYVVGNVTGSVNLSHQWRGELELKLISPSGRSATLWTGDELDSNTNLSFSFSKSDFNGTGASGSWRLRIEDRVEGDGGTLNNWNLAFNTREEQLGKSSNQTSITVSSLKNGETYSCYATSLDSQGIESGASRSRSALVGNTPGKPTITVDPEDKTALVTVKSVATGGLDITRYEGVCQSSRGVRTVTSTSKTIEVAPLTNGLGYLCKARARNQQGWGPF